MINLLPPKEKEQLFLEKNKKLVVILGCILTISLICLALVLFLIKLYVSERVNNQKSILNFIETKNQAPDFSYYNDLIEKYNTNLIKVNTFYKKEIYFSDVIKTILDVQKPDGLFFNDMSIENDKENNKTKVAVFGTSDTRDNLLIFKNNIESNNKIRNVYFPANSWTKTKDVNFNVTFEILNNEK
ncbi:MAG: hypothetical protein HY219_01155 [Candidatus Staskawiczbacteria bacterium]|nr:hypothetical protein [Candidatus Staskawiczbacteria bacterium]